MRYYGGRMLASKITYYARNSAGRIYPSLANSLLLAREHSPDVTNKPVSTPYLEQGYRWNNTTFNLKVEF